MTSDGLYDGLLMTSLIRYDESRRDAPPSTARGAPLGDAPPPARERAQYDAPPPPQEDRYGPGYSGFSYGGP